MEEDTPNETNLVTTEPNAEYEEPNVEVNESTSSRSTSEQETNAILRAYQPLLNFRRGNVIARFTGSSSKIEAQAWISLYERVSIGMSGEHRIQALTTYLTDDALTWCAQEIAVDLTLTWDDVKKKFLARYRTAIIPPSVAAEQCRLTRKDTVQSYAQEKMRLLRLANTTLESAIPLLTAGTPSYRPALYAANPDTFDGWLRLALTIENSTMDRPFRNRNENVNVTQ